MERLQAVLALAESITSCRDPEELFRRLARQLPALVPFDRLGLVLLEPERGVTSARLFDTTGTKSTTCAEPVDGTHAGWIVESQQPLIVPDTAAETRWPGAMADLQQHGIVSLCTLPLTTARRRVGTLGFGSRHPITYTAADIDFLSEIAKLVAVAAENALHFQAAQALQHQLTIERVEGGATTLAAVERMHILRMLGETNWTLGGPRGAAARLGMKRTTLQSLMKRLGISRPRAA